ncbi:MAG: ABC transporter permease [Candidatus Omnitrophica bacterium]|nr:ABC transporter permease [Candidatus Omnitrophota bacterium]
MIKLFYKFLKYYKDYRDLYFILIWKQFSVRYKQAILGVVWAVIQPLSLMGIFTLVFSRIMPVKISTLPQPIFFYSGLLPWAFFSSSVNYSIPSLVSNYDLIRKIYFPREILPIAGIAIAFIDFMIAAVIFIILLFLYHIPITWCALYFLPLVALLLLFTISFCLILTVVNVYYRDVQLAINFLLQLWFFATPIFYPIGMIPAKYKFFIYLNPLCFIIDSIRKSVIGGAPISPYAFLFMFCYAIILFVISFNFFRIAERKFADVL